MISHTIKAVAALVALAVSVTVAVVGAAAALYILLEPLVGRAGAAALVSALFALIVAVCVLVTANRGGHQDHHHDGGHGDFDFVGKIFDMARQKPILAAAGAIAAGLLAIRNPALVATLIAAFIEKPRGPRR